ncbi:MAG TPA: hypothetical protein VKX16_14475 [Chloroflexota bacterium]|nr:hypothetical protein [Chloroflexota bacterium]
MKEAPAKLVRYLEDGSGVVIGALSRLQTAVESAPENGVTRRAGDASAC